MIAAPFLGVYPSIGLAFLFQGFIAVVIGGMGRYPGATMGIPLLGLARAFGDHFADAKINLPFLETTIRGIPAIAKASTVLIMAIALLVRSADIFGKKELGYDHTVTNVETEMVSMAESVSPNKPTQHFHLDS